MSARPYYADEWRELAERATSERDRRAAMYPALVASGKFDAVKAASDQAAWEAIAADWQWVLTHVRPDAVDVHPADKRDAIAIAIQRATGALARAAAHPPEDREAAQIRLEQLEALAFHHANDPSRRDIYWLTRFNIEVRRRYPVPAAALADAA